MSGAAGYGLSSSIKHVRGAKGIGLDTTIKYLRRTTSSNAGNGLRSTINHLRGAASNNMGVFMNAANKLGPHTQTDRGTCPGAGF
jgi:hypothetical protein